MKTKLQIRSFVAVLLLATASLRGQTTLLQDDYAVTTAGTGFALGSGVNTGINPPATNRLTGAAAIALARRPLARGRKQCSRTTRIFP